MDDAESALVAVLKGLLADAELEVGQYQDRVAGLLADVEALTVGRQLLELDLGEHRRRIAELELRARPPKRDRDDPIFCGQPGSSRFRIAVNAATRRGKAWDLTPEQYYPLAGAPCSYCGRPTGKSIGLDRLDNAVGYTEDNVVPSCGTCNISRQRASGAHRQAA